MPGDGTSANVIGGDAIWAIGGELEGGMVEVDVHCIFGMVKYWWSWISCWSVAADTKGKVDVNAAKAKAECLGCEDDACLGRVVRGLNRYSRRCL